MRKDAIKCVLIGRRISIYHDLARLIRKVEPASRFKQVEVTRSAIINTLRKINEPCLVFISDEISLSFEHLSDLVWQYCSDATVVVVTKKTSSKPINKSFNTPQFSKLRISSDQLRNETELNFIIQLVRDKKQLRLCKSLLGVSEKRCQWLVDSSREAIAFIARDMHWYANTAYLELFGFKSIRELRSITIKDLIEHDEHHLIDSFRSTKGKANDIKKALTLTMNKQNGSKFRANIYLIPSVYKSHKCYQIWVKKINSLEGAKKIPERVLFDENNVLGEKSSELGSTNPFSHLLDNTENKQGNNIKDEQENTPKTQTIDKVYSQKTLLKGVLRRKEATIVGEKLKYLKLTNKKKVVVPHQILSLKVASAQKKGVDDLLENLSGSFNPQMRLIFWDKVKFSRLLQILVKRKQVPINLLIRITEASIEDESFMQWLTPGLERIGQQTTQLTFLVPTTLNTDQYRKTISIVNQLRTLKCKIALDNFTASKESLYLLKRIKPDYVKFSLPWVRHLQNNELKEIRLSSLIRQLEERKIKVIVPCSFSNLLSRKLYKNCLKIVQ